MLNEETLKYRKLSGDSNPNTPISRIGGYLDGFQKGREDAIDELKELLLSDKFQCYELDAVFETSTDWSYSNCVSAFEEYVEDCAKELKEQKNDKRPV